MLTDNEKRRMSDSCGWSKEQRTDDIKKCIRKTSYDNDEEHGLARKTIKKILDHIIYGTLLTEEDVAEFIKYYNTIENVKKEVDAT